jgi:single-strand DNA-binding protein
VLLFFFFAGGSMAGLNRVTLIGNLGTDPDVRRTPKQMAVCRFRLATSERRKDATGNPVEHTEWHNVVAFGKTAENCAAFLRKGRQVYVEGSIRTRARQDPEGQSRHATEVAASNVQFLGGKDTAPTAAEPGVETIPPDLLDSAAIPGFEEDDLAFAAP